MSPYQREQQILREQSRSHDGGTTRRSGTKPPLVDQERELLALRLLPQRISFTTCQQTQPWCQVHLQATERVSERHHSESLSRAPTTPSHARGGSQLSATIADFRANRDHIIAQLMSENAALRLPLVISKPLRQPKLCR
eukprot:1521748-Amphidinium_carterae.1